MIECKISEEAASQFKAKSNILKLSFANIVSDLGWGELVFTDEVGSPPLVFPQVDLIQLLGSIQEKLFNLSKSKRGDFEFEDMYQTYFLSGSLSGGKISIWDTYAEGQKKLLFPRKKFIQELSKCRVRNWVTFKELFPEIKNHPQLKESEYELFTRFGLSLPTIE